VQEAWLKVSSADIGGVANLGGWLTTVVARVCLDMLRSRRARREQPLGVAVDTVPAGSTPETEVAFADAIGPALLVVLDMLAPQERVAFVLHDLFDLSSRDRAIVDRTPAAADSSPSRARRRVRGAAAPANDVAQNRRAGERLLAASPRRRLRSTAHGAVARRRAARRCDVRARAAAYQERGGPILAPEVRGAAQVATGSRGRATAALEAFIDGEPGGRCGPYAVRYARVVFTIAAARSPGIDLVMDDEASGALDIEIG